MHLLIVFSQNIHREILTGMTGARTQPHLLHYTKWLNQEGLKRWAGTMAGMANAETRVGVEMALCLATGKKGHLSPGDHVSMKI